MRDYYDIAQNIVDRAPGIAALAAKLEAEQAKYLTAEQSIAKIVNSPEFKTAARNMDISQARTGMGRFLSLPERIRAHRASELRSDEAA